MTLGIQSLHRATSSRAQGRRMRGSMVAALGLCGVLAGCNSQSAAAGPSVAAPTATSGAAPASPGNATNPHLRVVALPDPSLGDIPATFVAVPEGWKAAGEVNLNQCASLPNPSWNASSADAQSSFEVLPEFAWRWGSTARFAQGCDPLSGMSSAAQFLQLFAGKLPGQVRIVGRIPVDAAFRRREEQFTAKMDKSNLNMAPALRVQNLGDVASFRATDAAGHELRLRAWVQCRQGNQGGDCFAKVDVLRTKQGRLDALMAVVDGANLVQDVPNQQWQAAYMARQQRVGQGQLDKLLQNAKAGSDMLHQQYVESSARLQREHEIGLKQIERTGQDANAIAMNAMNARSTAASDWRDYAADQQTVSGVNGTYKTSSQYTNVWSNPYGPPLSNGRTFGTTDNTADPNSATDSNWTQDVKVHGNGQHY